MKKKKHNHWDDELQQSKPPLYFHQSVLVFLPIQSGLSVFCEIRLKAEEQLNRKDAMLQQEGEVSL